MTRPLSLIGHDNPIGKYPSPVLPILSENGALYGVYEVAGRDTFELQPLDSPAQYERHSDSTSRSISHYDHRMHALFAISKSDIVCYERRDRDLIFRLLVCRPGLLADNPFLALSLARQINDLALIQQSISACVDKLRYSASSFLDDWYPKERQQVVALFARRASLLNSIVIPDDFADALRLPGGWAHATLRSCYASGPTESFKRQELTPLARRRMRRLLDKLQRCHSNQLMSLGRQVEIMQPAILEEVALALLSAQGVGRDRLKGIATRAGESAFEPIMLALARTSPSSPERDDLLQVFEEVACRTPSVRAEAVFAGELWRGLPVFVKQCLFTNWLRMATKPLEVEKARNIVRLLALDPAKQLRELSLRAMAVLGISDNELDALAFELAISNSEPASVRILASQLLQARQTTWMQAGQVLEAIDNKTSIRRLRDLLLLTSKDVLMSAPVKEFTRRLRSSTQSIRHKALIVTAHLGASGESTVDAVLEGVPSDDGRVFAEVLDTLRAIGTTAVFPALRCSILCVVVGNSVRAAELAALVRECGLGLDDVHGVIDELPTEWFADDRRLDAVATVFGIMCDADIEHIAVNIAFGSDKVAMLCMRLIARISANRRIEPSDIARFADSLPSRSEIVIEHALRCFARIRVSPEYVAGVLDTLLVDGAQKVRAAVEEMLVAHGAGAARVVGRSLSRSRANDVWGYARLRVLQLIGRQSVVATQDVVGVFVGRSVLRNLASQVLVGIGGPAVDALVGVVVDREYSELLRRKAAETLGQMGPQAQAALPTLDLIQHDPRISVELYQAIARAIARIDDRYGTRTPVMAR